MLVGRFLSRKQAENRSPLDTCAALFSTQLEYHDPFGQSITISSDITEEKVVFCWCFPP